MPSDSGVKTIVVNKIGSVAPVPTPPAPALPPVAPAPAPVPMGGKQRTFPKGILRKTARRKPVAPKPSGDPTSSRKKTLRIFTGSGQTKMRATIRQRVKRMDDKTIRQKLVDKKLISSHSKASAPLLRKMVEEAVGAGLLKL